METEGILYTQIFLNLLPDQKSGRKSSTGQNTIKLQKQALQKIRTQILQNAEGRHFLHTHTNKNIFKLLHAKNPCTMWTSKNAIFVRATPCQRGFAPNCPCTNWGVCVCVFLQNRALGPWGGQFVILGLSCCCHIFSFEMPIFIVRKCVVPEPAFRWTPNRPVFLKKRGPRKHRPAYMHVYIHIERERRKKWRKRQHSIRKPQGLHERTCNDHTDA